MNSSGIGQLRRRVGRLSAASLCAILFASGVVACGNGNPSAESAGNATAASADSTASTSSSSVLGPAAKLVPDSLKNKTLNVVVLSDYPPYGYMEDGNLVGETVDLTKAIAADTGLDIKISAASFDTMIPGLQAHRWDFAVPTFGVTDARRKILDFVTMGRSATGFIVRSDSGIKINTGADLCGHSVGVLQGSNQAVEVQAISADECGGKSPVELKTFQSADAPVALASSRLDVIACDIPQFGPILKQGSGKFEAQPFQHSELIDGAGFPKGSELAPVVLQAIKDTMANGKYHEIYGKYDDTASEIASPELLK